DAINFDHDRDGNLGKGTFSSGEFGQFRRAHEGLARMYDSNSDGRLDNREYAQMVHDLGEEVRAERQAAQHPQQAQHARHDDGDDGRLLGGPDGEAPASQFTPQGAPLVLTGAQTDALTGQEALKLLNAPTVTIGGHVLNNADRLNLFMTLTSHEVA